MKYQTMINLDENMYDSELEEIFDVIAQANQNLPWFNSDLDKKKLEEVYEEVTYKFNRRIQIKNFYKFDNSYFFILKVKIDKTIFSSCISMFNNLVTQ